MWCFIHVEIFCGLGVNMRFCVTRLVLCHWVSLAVECLIQIHIFVSCSVCRSKSIVLVFIFIFCSTGDVMQNFIPVSQGSPTEPCPLLFCLLEMHSTVGHVSSAFAVFTDVNAVVQSPLCSSHLLFILLWTSGYAILFRSGSLFLAIWSLFVSSSPQCWRFWVACTLFSAEGILVTHLPIPHCGVWGSFLGFGYGVYNIQFQ